METLNTITTNALTLWNAPKDWSLDGGLIWLTAMVTVGLVGLAIAMAIETRKSN